MSASSSVNSSPEAPARAAAIVVAGGSGRRMGSAGGVRKQYLEIGGETVLLRALRPFVDHPAIRTVIVVLPAEDLASLPEWLERLPVVCVGGGAERSDSVWNGLEALPDELATVLIHDGARPFVTREIIDRVLDQAAGAGAIAAVPVTDTIKEVGEDGRISATVDRARLWQAQTPQGFPLRMIREAYERARREGWQGTDEASFCERYRLPVVVVEGSRENLKITTPEDLLLATAIAARLRPANSGVQRP